MNSQNNIDLKNKSLFKQGESDEEDTEKVKKVPDYVKGDTQILQMDKGKPEDESSSSDSQEGDSESSNEESNGEDSTVKTPIQVSKL